MSSKPLMCSKNRQVSEKLHRAAKNFRVTQEIGVAESVSGYIFSTRCRINALNYCACAADIVAIMKHTANSLERYLLCRNLVLFESDCAELTAAKRKPILSAANNAAPHLHCVSKKFPPLNSL